MKKKMGKKTSMSLLNQVVVKAPPTPKLFESYVLRSSCNLSTEKEREDLLQRHPVMQCMLFLVNECSSREKKMNTTTPRVPEKQ